MPIMPPNFDGAKFLAQHPELNSDDFWAVGNTLYCPSLPNLTDADLLNCVLTPEELAEMADLEQAIEQLKSQYVWARDTLRDIINQPEPTAVNLATIKVIAQALKDEARILQGILKEAKRRW